jgi:catechol 2,3-dioxygenase-like lactoylglutathione lyase family enzyme
MFARLNHIAICTDHYAINAKFYEALFGLKTAKNLRPARAIFAGMSINRPGPGHIGFKVKDMDAFKAEEKRIGEKNTFLASRRLGGSEESEVRRELFASNALGSYQTADPDGTWIDVVQE